jgi:hypothetical protein
MIRPPLLWSAAIVFLSMIQGCASVEPGQRYAGRSVGSLKSAYVVEADNTDHTIGTYIQGELATRNVQATIGPLSAKPAHVEFYVTYSEHWQWDLTMYLSSLDIQFLDNRTGQLIANGAFKNSLLHTYPDLGDTTRQVIDSIYNAK